MYHLAQDVMKLRDDSDVTTAVIQKGLREEEM